MWKRAILCIFCWIPFLLSLCIALIPFSCFLFYWVFVTKILRPLFRRDLTPINDFEAVFGSNSFFNGGRGAVGIVHALETPLDPELLIQRLSSTIFGTEVNEGRVSKYKRLTSIHPTYWLGYPFWTKSINEFDIRHHITCINMERKDGHLMPHAIDNVIIRWLYEPFRQNQPLWDCVLINDTEGKCYFGFRTHHILGDGYSILKFLFQLFDNPIQVSASVAHPTTGKERLKMIFWSPLTLTNHFIQTLFLSDYFTTRKKSEKVCIGRVLVSLADLKAARRLLSSNQVTSVSLSHAILLILGSAIRKAILAGEFGSANKRYLTSFLAVMTLPKSTPHPEGDFCNHWNGTVHDILLGKEILSGSLKHSVEQLRWQDESKTVEVLRLLHELDSIYPTSILNFGLRYFSYPRVGCTNLPGPGIPVQIGGNEVTQFHAFYGLQTRHASFNITSFSYKNEVALLLLANEESISKDVTSKLLQKYFVEEMKSLISAEV